MTMRERLRVHHQQKTRSVLRCGDDEYGKGALAVRMMCRARSLLGPDRFIRKAVSVGKQGLWIVALLFVCG